MAVSIQNLVLAQAESLEIQALDACMSDFQALSKRQGGGNRVSFVTEMELDNASVFTGNPRMEKMAFIVWLDRAKAQNVLNAKTPEGVDKEHEAALRSLMLALMEVIDTGADKALLHGVDLNVPLDNLKELFEGGS